MPEEPTDLTWGPAPAADDPLAGTPYAVVGHIATGGMGEVYLADHRSHPSRYVVKLLHARLASDAQLVDRMRVEAQALAVLRHRSIVHVFDSGTTPTGRPYIVMERLQGSTLADELRQRGPLPVAEALRWVRELLSALQAAHDIGLVHRDVKLSNLFLHEAAGAPRVLKVLDFGIAKVLEGASDKAPQPLHQPTEIGVVIGTPAYVSPEAVLGRPVDHRADVYAAGIVLYLLLCGRGPFWQKRRELAAMAARVHEVPLPPSVHAQKPVPAAVDAAVMMALAREPEERFQSAREFELALERAAQAGAESIATSAAPFELDDPPTAFSGSATTAFDRASTLGPGQTRPELALTEALDGVSVLGLAGHTERLETDTRPIRREQDALPTLTTVRAEPLAAVVAPPLPAAIASPALRLALTALACGWFTWWLLNLGWQ